MMNVHAIFEWVRNLLVKVPIPLWLSVLIFAGLVAYVIEQRAITRFIIWASFTVILTLLIYFA